MDFDDTNRFKVYYTMSELCVVTKKIIHHDCKRKRLITLGECAHVKGSEYETHFLKYIYYTKQLVMDHT